VRLFAEIKRCAKVWSPPHTGPRAPNLSICLCGAFSETDGNERKMIEGAWGHQMRIPAIAQLCSAALCGSLILFAGCGNPPPQTLASLTVIATPSTLSVGGAAVMKAVAHLSDGTTQDVTAGTQWTLSNSALGRISNGALTATSPGTLTVQAAYAETTPGGSSPTSADTSPENLTASTQVTITAKPSTNTPSITWNSPAGIIYGAALSSTQLNATANVPGTFIYSPAAGVVLKAGTQTLSVVFTPTDTTTYSSATATLQLSVAQATPIITWTAPAAVVQGTALSSAQLDANANVPGVFTYSPAVGNVPAAGTLQLSAAFTPTDTTDYSSPTAHNTLSVTAPPTSPGPFKYTGSPVLSTLVPPNPATALSSELFGMTIHRTSTPFPTFPISTFRFWDVDPWQAVEPSSGQLVWTSMDTMLAQAKANGVSDFIYTFGDVPAWASTNPSEACTGGYGPGTCAPPDMAAFDNFATQLVQRYCGIIKYYETWNEPNNPQYWSGTNAQLLTVAQHLYQIAKDPANCAPNGGANPNQVLTPSISGVSSYSLSWLDSYLAAAGPQYPYADIASFHGYGSATDPEEIVTQVQSLNQTLAKHGLSSLPLWNTEASWGKIALVGQQQASWLMRYHMALATTGVSRFIWYAYDNCLWGTLWEGSNCPTPQMPVGSVTEAGKAYAVIETWLSGAVLPSCQVYDNGLWICELQRAGGYEAWMLWSSTGTGISVPIPADSVLTIYRDWQNNVDTLPAELTVDEMPVLLENHDL
jgi:hypothetical protein